MKPTWTELLKSIEASAGANVARAAQVQRAVAEMLAGDTLPPHVRRLRIACLRAVTIEPLLPLLVSSMAARNFAASVELGQLGNYRAEAVEPGSFLRQGDFDVCIVLVPLEAIAADIGIAAGRTEDWRASLADFFACLDRLSDRFAGPIIVCNFASPAPLLARRLQSQQSQSARYAYSEANQLLAAHCEGRRNVTVCDLAWLAGGAGSAEFFSARNFATVLQPFSPGGFQLLADEWAELCQLHFRGPAKCIVLDCDNTLWGGIVGEDGVHDIRLGETYPGVCFQQFQRQLKEVKQLGFLLALNSKNNEADVRAAFAEHPGMVLRWDDFAAARVNWLDKAANMTSLAAELNLDVDSFVFIDDNPFELEMVRAAFPGIRTVAVPAETWKLPELLPNCAALDRTVLTNEDLAKAEMYTQEQRRNEVREQSASVDDYLGRLGLRMTIERFESARHGPRAAQLLQKTNQFNLTTRRYTEKELLELQRAGALIYLASLKDRFGDYGRIALAIVRFDGAVPELDTFLMSCRAIGRKAETVLLEHLVDRLHCGGFGKLRASFVATQRNQVSAGFLSEHGFQLLSSTGQESCYERDMGAAFPEAARYYEQILHSEPADESIGR